MNITLNGNNYELPKRTPKVAKLFDDFNSTVGDVKLHYKAIEIVEKIIGKEALSEIFGTADKEEIDTVDSVLAVKRIDQAYMQPMLEYQKEREAEEARSPVFEQVKAVGDSVGKIKEMIK